MVTDILHKILPHIRTQENILQENNISDKLMETFLKEHYHMCEMGDHDHVNNNVQWDYISSLFFTGTILTTIGIVKHKQTFYFKILISIKHLIIKHYMHCSIANGMLIIDLWFK